MGEDLHALIAFASKIINKKLATPNEVHRNALFVPKYGILPTDNQATNKRTLPILDAIAALSIFQESRQVVAIALQMNQDEQTITLTVAENRPDRVEPRVVAQIDAIWKILRSLSDEYSRLRSLSPTMQDPEQWGDRSPEPPITPELSEARLDLVRLVYTFCWKKMSVRVTKWWPHLDALSRNITSYLYIDGHEDPSGLMKKFLGAVVMFRMAFPIIKDRPDELFATDLWGVFSNRMETAVQKTVDILHDEEDCEAWGKRFKREFDYVSVLWTMDTNVRPDPNYEIPVRRALEKLTSLHRYIEVLVRFANSPRLRPALTFEPSISLVTPPARRQVTLPSSIHEWETTVDYVCAGKELATADWARKQATDLAGHYDKSYLCVTHCECSLIAHLEATPAETPPFSYIGVSKLSCRACMLWIAAFNRRAGRQYVTRGAHGKWYWPWTAPAGLADYEAAVMAKAVRADCVRFIQASGHFRAGSDSTDASVDKSPSRSADVAREMDREIDGGIASMVQELKAKNMK